MTGRDNPNESYELLIEWKVKVSDADVENYLEYDEVIRGQPFQIAFSFENMGKTDFPGGHIDEFEFRLSSRWTYTQSPSSEEKSIPKIPTGAKVKKSWWFTMGNEGLVLPRFKIIPEKEGEIKYYASQDKPPTGDFFGGFGLFVVSRERIEIIKLLRELLEKLGRRGGE